MDYDELSIQKELESERKILVQRTVWYVSLYQTANQNYPIWYVGEYVIYKTGYRTISIPLSVRHWDKLPPTAYLYPEQINWGEKN